MKFENMEDDFETSHLLYTQQKPGGAHQLHRKGGYSGIHSWTMCCNR